MKTILIFLIGLLLPAAKPCLSAVTLREGTPGTVASQEVSPGTVARRDSSQVKPSSNSPLAACLQSLPILEPKLKFINFFARSPLITDLLSLTTEIKPLLPYTDYFLGTEKPVTYLVLLQNNHEMRANGGFFGSYAVVTIDSTPSSPPPYEGGGRVGVRFQDIYVPDGALVGHVDPPAPIQTAFKQGWFRLRDSDWEPDWPTTAKTIRWFLEKGNEVSPDLLLTLNLSTIEKIMKVVGEITVPEYDFKLTSDNLYALLQNQAELNFFQGSTQKKDVLTATGRAVTKKLSSLKFDQYVQLVQILIDQLNHGNLLVNTTNPEIQKILEERNWAGKLTVPSCLSTPSVSPPYEGGDQVGVSCLNDTVLLIETNLGANKANCCVERKTAHTITKGETEISHLINLTFTNSSPLENPLPPRFYGGNYISYLRFYIPKNARNIRLTAQPTLPKTLLQYPTPFDGLNQKSFERKFAYGLTEVGFFHLTAAGTKSAAQLSYDLPLSNSSGNDKVSPGTNSSSDDKVSPGTVARTRDSSQVKPIYHLTLLKQHGLEKSPQEINLFGKNSSTNLESDFSISTSLESPTN